MDLQINNKSPLSKNSVLRFKLEDKKFHDYKFKDFKNKEKELQFKEALLSDLE